MKKNPTAEFAPPPLTRDQLAEMLGGWKGYTFGTMGRLPVDADHAEEIWLELLPQPERTKRCSSCRQSVEAVHDTEERWVQDLPILGTPVELLVHRCRLACPRCGPKLEHLDWLAPYSRLTRRFMDNVAQLCQVLPIRHVADYFDLHWATVKEIDKAHLNATLPAPDLS